MELKKQKENIRVMETFDNLIVVMIFANILWQLC